MIGIIDYGMGNLHSVRNALTRLKIGHRIISSPDEIGTCQALILPGVGAFPDAMATLNEKGFTHVLRAAVSKGKPLLGICLGMQLLFEDSTEFGLTQGLSLIEGHVVPIRAPGLKIPHMGWNALSFNQPQDALLKDVPDGSYVYFVHSFRADTDSRNVVAYTEYGEQIPALVKSPVLPVYGAQFHPEKSHDTGLSMLKSFCIWAGEEAEI